MSPYVVFLLYMVAILSLVALMLILNRLLGPKPVDSAVKLEPFECGATAVDLRNVKAVPAKYYAVAIVFILFDLETVFLFIWALGAQPVTGTMLITFVHLHGAAGPHPAVRLSRAPDRRGDRVNARPFHPDRADAAARARRSST